MNRLGLRGIIYFTIFSFTTICFQSDIARTQTKTKSTLGWDLTYSSVLKRNKVKNFLWISSDEKYHSPALGLLKEWKEPTITSSILFESPAGHGDARTVLWLIRTKDGAYYHLLYVNAHLSESWGAGVAEPTLFDELLKEVAAWQQAKRPRHSKDVVAADDYFGFLSIYDGRRSRQMVLTSEDYFLKDEQDKDVMKDGRVMQVLMPVLEKLMKDH